MSYRGSKNFKRYNRNHVLETHIGLFRAVFRPNFQLLNDNVWHMEIFLMGEYIEKENILRMDLLSCLPNLHIVEYLYKTAIMVLYIHSILSKTIANIYIYIIVQYDTSILFDILLKFLLFSVHHSDIFDFGNYPLILYTSVFIVMSNLREPNSYSRRLKEESNNALNNIQ